MYTISDLLKLCIVASEEDLYPSSPIIKDLDISIHNVLKLVLQLIPTDEGEFLDHLRPYFGQKDNEPKTHEGQ